MHCYKRIIFIFKQITLSDNNIKGKDKKFSESLKLKKAESTLHYYVLIQSVQFVI